MYVYTYIYIYIYMVYMTWFASYLWYLFDFYVNNIFWTTSPKSKNGGYQMAAPIYHGCSEPSDLPLSCFVDALFYHDFSRTTFVPKRELCHNHPFPTGPMATTTNPRKFSVERFVKKSWIILWISVFWNPKLGNDSPRNVNNKSVPLTRIIMRGHANHSQDVPRMFPGCFRSFI